MKIDHIGIWVKDLEKMKSFYEIYFGRQSGDKYHNPKKEFTSYFLSFEDGARIEFMHVPGQSTVTNKQKQVGLTHLAFNLGSNIQVDLLTNKLRNDGYIITGEPRTTGDGYYESVIQDPEGNSIELVG